ncbi:MAG: DNA methyltransferase [Psychrobacillus sp.]
MSIVQLEDKLIELINKRDDKENFIFELLEIFDFPKATITRLKKGNQNLSKDENEIHLKGKLWFKQATSGAAFEGFASLENKVEELNHKPRYLLVTDFENLLAKDLKTQDTLDIEFKALPLHFDFFLAWMGIEKVDFEKENPADLKAVERFARLYDAILKENPDLKNHEGLNKFLIRILFCLFAEDTGVFPKNSFTNFLKAFTKEDGSDLNVRFKELFNSLDSVEREKLPTHLKNFDYVGGQLFKDIHTDLVFSSKIRKLIIECGELLNWYKINPDILGSMIQGVTNESNRSKLGMHYTSVPNILKVIKPLFLEELYEYFGKNYNNMEKLSELYERIGKIKFFDPACGSGNFLIITYKELRKLEIKILIRQRELSPYLMYIPSVTLDQFYGIEIDDFAHDVAKLSLWIAEHQMNMELEELFNDKVRAILPLQSSGNIVYGNALKLNWIEVCPRMSDEEVYLFGNPPYLGFAKQNNIQKNEMKELFENEAEYKNIIDFISCWFYLGSKYIENSNAKCAFVSTNSICQGEQVSVLWPILLKRTEIIFAYSSFKWSNNAKNNAGVTVIIIGLASNQKKVQNKYLYIGEHRKNVSNITPYLTDGENIIIYKSNKSLFGLPAISYGSKPTDGGALIFTREEYETVIEKYSELEQYFKKYVGADELLNSTYRYCLWLDEASYNKIQNHPFIKDRVRICSEFRLKSKKNATRKLASTPYMFAENRYKSKNAIVIPEVSSENRYYIPIGLTDSNTVLSNRVYEIYIDDLYVMGILMSKMHMVWTKAVGGKLETRYMYSAGLCYNTFPFPKISLKTKEEIKNAVLEILDIREESGGTLAELYHNETMPSDLLAAHVKLDEKIERLYRNNPFNSDEERLEHLLNIYQKLLG